MEDIVDSPIGPFSNVTVEPNVTFHCNGTCLTMPQNPILEESVWSNIIIDYMTIKKYLEAIRKNVLVFIKNMVTRFPKRPASRHSGIAIIFI
jgi:hypothetical protein